MGDDRKKVHPLSSMMGLLRIRIKRGINLAVRKRGINLAVRNVNSSDPYILIRHGKQKLKTSVIKKNINPMWNEDLTLCIMDPNDPVKLLVYDYDMFSTDVQMGDAEINVKLLLEAAKLNLDGYPDGAVIKKVNPSDQNCVVWSKRQAHSGLVYQAKATQR